MQGIALFDLCIADFNDAVNGAGRIGFVAGLR